LRPAASAGSVVSGPDPGRTRESGWSGAAAGRRYHGAMDESGPKSAFEIAMERLRKRDAEQGIELTSLTEEQRAAIAEVRNFYEAKLAEQEVLHQSTLARTWEGDARAALEQGYRRDRERLVSDRDAKIERIRRGNQ
jgi:hypothetical protein